MLSDELDTFWLNDEFIGYCTFLAVEKIMLPHQQRVVDEKTDLDEKLTKLLAFFQTDMFKSLLEAERSRLRNQARFMDGYSAVLEERIAAFAN